MGHWDESDASSYNLENPIFRDTFTVPKGGWSAVRFVVSLMHARPPKLLEELEITDCTSSMLQAAANTG